MIALSAGRLQGVSHALNPWLDTHKTHPVIPLSASGSPSRVEPMAEQKEKKPSNIAVDLRFVDTNHAHKDHVHEDNVHKTMSTQMSYIKM